MISSRHVTLAALLVPGLYLGAGLFFSVKHVALLQIILILIPALILLKKTGCRQRPWEKLDLLGYAGIIALTIALSWLLNKLLGIWLQYFPLPDVYANMYKQMLAPRARFDLVRQIIEMGAVAALAEELFFRGFLQRAWIQNGMRKNLAVFLTASIFALYHLNPWYLPFYFILGLWMGYAFLLSGRLEYAMLAHLANNTYALIAHHLQK